MVVEVARDPLALGLDLPLRFEPLDLGAEPPLARLAHAEDHGAQQPQPCEEPEPPRLPPRRADLDGHRQRGLVPHPVGASGPDVQGVAAGVEVGVGGGPPGAGGLPPVFHALQPEGVAVLLGRREVQRRHVERDGGLRVREGDGGRARACGVVDLAAQHAHGRHGDRWRGGAHAEALGVEDGEAAQAAEGHPAVAQPQERVAVEFLAGQPVVGPVGLHLARGGVVAREAAVGGDPEPAAGVRHDAVGGAVGEPVGLGDVREAPAARGGEQPVEAAAVGREPHRAAGVAEERGDVVVAERLGVVRAVLERGDAASGGVDDVGAGAPEADPHAAVGGGEDGVGEVGAELALGGPVLRMGHTTSSAPSAAWHGPPPYVAAHTLPSGAAATWSTPCDARALGERDLRPRLRLGIAAPEASGVSGGPERAVSAEGDGADAVLPQRGGPRAVLARLARGEVEAVEAAVVGADPERARRGLRPGPSRRWTRARPRGRDRRRTGGRRCGGSCSAPRPTSRPRRARCGLRAASASSRPRASWSPSPTAGARSTPPSRAGACRAARGRPAWRPRACLWRRASCPARWRQRRRRCAGPAWRGPCAGRGA